MVPNLILDIGGGGVPNLILDIGGGGVPHFSSLHLNYKYYKYQSDISKFHIYDVIQCYDVIFLKDKCEF